ncbi:MAG: hypothetical protein M3Y80_03595 [Verrucomicrobiota bacterium]|nr:hypothetical protein [Verrucomicrobiota bacterium]
MLSRSGILLLGGGLVLLVGCQTAKRAAVTSFHVIDAPAQYVRNRIDGETTTTTTTTHTTDVVNPGYPVYAPTPTPRPVAPPRVVAQPRSTPPPPRVSSTPPRSPQRTTTSTTSSTASSTPRPAASEPRQFPTARPVPGKPGYVYSIDPSGGIVDVTGYKSGEKAKDPYTQQIFIVP